MAKNFIGRINPVKRLVPSKQAQKGTIAPKLGIQSNIPGIHNNRMHILGGVESCLRELQDKNRTAQLSSFISYNNIDKSVFGKTIEISFREVGKNSEKSVWSRDVLSMLDREHVFVSYQAEKDPIFGLIKPVFEEIRNNIISNAADNGKRPTTFTLTFDSPAVMWEVMRNPEFKSMFDIKNSRARIVPKLAPNGKISALEYLLIKTLGFSKNHDLFTSFVEVVVARKNWGKAGGGIPFVDSFSGDKDLVPEDRNPAYQTRQKTLREYFEKGTPFGKETMQLMKYIFDLIVREQRKPTGEFPLGIDRIKVNCRINHEKQLEANAKNGQGV